MGKICLFLMTNVFIGSAIGLGGAITVDQEMFKGKTSKSLQDLGILIRLVEDVGIGAFAVLVLPAIAFGLGIFGTIGVCAAIGGGRGLAHNIVGHSEMIQDAAHNVEGKINELMGKQL
jgi:hypothetical protein